MQFFEHMRIIDQHSLLSCGWPRDNGNIYSTHIETSRAGSISRQILVLSKHSLFTMKGKGT